jgi:hypothetical protein
MSSFVRAATMERIYWVMSKNRIRPVRITPSIHWTQDMETGVCGATYAIGSMIDGLYYPSESRAIYRSGPSYIYHTYETSVPWILIVGIDVYSDVNTVYDGLIHLGRRGTTYTRRPTQ